MMINYIPVTMTFEEIARELNRADSWGDVSELVDYLVEVGEVSGDPDSLESELEEWITAHGGEEGAGDGKDIEDAFLDKLRGGSHTPFTRVKAFCHEYLRHCGMKSWRVEAVLDTMVGLVTEITPVNALQVYEGVASMIRFTSAIAEGEGEDILLEGIDGDLYMGAMNEVLEVCSMLVLGMDAPLLSWYERTEAFTRVLIVDLTWADAFRSLCDVMHMCFTYTTKYLLDNPYGYSDSNFQVWSRNREMTAIYFATKYPEPNRFYRRLEEGSKTKEN